MTDIEFYEETVLGSNNREGSSKRTASHLDFLESSQQKKKKSHTYFCFFFCPGESELLASH